MGKGKSQFNKLARLKRGAGKRSRGKEKDELAGLRVALKAGD